MSGCHSIFSVTRSERERCGCFFREKFVLIGNDAQRWNLEALETKTTFSKSGKGKISMNFLEDHFSRELGALPLRKWQLRKSIWHQSHQMLRHVVLSKHRKFKKLPVLVSNGQVLYEDGKLFLGHKGTSAMDCHFLREGGRGCDNLSKALRLRYSIPLKPNWKDQVRRLQWLQLNFT